MKKLVLFLTLITATINVFSQDHTISKSGLGTILQKCLDLPALQEAYPKDAQGNLKPLSVYYFAPEFIPTDVVIIKNGRQLPFKEITSTEKDVMEDFFLFEHISLTEAVAEVSFKFFNNTSGKQKVTLITVDLVKSENGWNIRNSKLTSQ